MLRGFGRVCLVPISQERRCVRRLGKTTADTDQFSASAEISEDGDDEQALRQPERGMRHVQERRGWFIGRSVSVERGRPDRDECRCPAAHFRCRCGDRRQ